MRIYEIRAAKGGQVVSVATVDSATAALMKLSDAQHHYQRVWVVDEKRADVSKDLLLARSWEERNGTLET